MGARLSRGWFRRMFGVGVVALAALVLAGANAVSAPSAQTTYIVQLDEPPLALYAGGITGLAPTMPAKLGTKRLNPSSAASVAYLNHLASRQSAVKTAMDLALGRSVSVKFRYRAAYNGMALQLTAAESQQVAALAGVKRVQRDELNKLLTDVGPAWIGANGIHDGTATGGLPGTKGEGIVVGIIDTGVNHDHPSFADIGPGDGFNHVNPRTRHYGVCAPLNVVLCNDKLIGMYDFTGTTPFDDNAHGSHTASTVAGNVLTAILDAPTLDYTKPISGVAPHANLITYKACTGLPAVGGCQVSATVASIDQATLDMVHVINFSIGGASRNPWTDPNAIAFLGANAAGVFGSVAAGNDGPGSSTIGSPSDAPWVMSVGASTHNRSLLSQLTDMAGGAVAPPATITGASVAAGIGPASIVYAGAPPYNTPLCGAGTADPTTGVGSEPAFDPGELEGKIVVCDRGTYGRVAKGQEVLDAGGIGMVLANDAASGDSLTADMHVLPAVHITFDDGQVLKNWIAAGGDPVARITGLEENTDAANGDVMASFSSRGPNPSVPGVIKPDVTAPGVDVYAAFNTPLTSVPPTAPEYGIISGTSMASPHAAGAIALLRALKPNWTPNQLKSALMTTGFTEPPGEGAEAHRVQKEDSATAADAFDMGGGRVELRRAARAGLLLDVASPLDYLNANPGHPTTPGDPKTLNIASMANDSCQTSCTWTRTVTSAASVPVTWTASVADPSGAALTVAPATFMLAAGATQTLTITATNTGLAPNAWRFGAVTLSPSVSSIPASRLPVAVRATGISVDPCVVPSETVVTDASGDQLAPTGVPNAAAYDIESLAVAGVNPTLDGSPGSFLEWTLKVDELNPDSLPRNSSWRMVWTKAPTTYFVDMNTFDATGVVFQYGSLDANGIFQTQGAADKGTFTPDGTIKITVAASKVGNPAAGAELTAINADTVLLVGGAGTGLLANVDTTGEGTYTLRECGTTGTAPDAVNDTAITAEGTPVTISVLTNDTHPQGEALTLVSATDPAHGTAVVNAGAGTITYTPDTGYSGTDSFSYTVRDPDGETDTADVFVTVEPLCPTGTFTDDLESGSDGWTPQTEANESPVSLTWAVREDPTTTNLMNHSWHSDATTLMAKDDRIVLPAQDLTGASQLTFWHRYGFEEGFDGGVLEVSTDGGAVWKDILETDATFDAGGYTGTISTEFDSPIGGRSAWTGGPLDAALAPVTQVKVNVGALAGPDVLFRFRLATDRLEVGAVVGAGWWIDDVTVTKTALDCPPPPNEPPVAVDDAASTNKNTAVTINVLANDSDPDGDPLTSGVVAQPANGSATRNADNTITYTPNPNFVGDDSFTYEIFDPNGLSSTATVRVTVVDESGPTPCFKYSPKKPNKNTNVKFDGRCTTDEQSSDSQLVFEWDFTSDGTPDATGIEVKHRFGAAGTYTVTLRVTDPAGNSNTTSKQIVVKHDDDDDDDDGPEHGGGGGDDDDDDDDDDGGDD